MTPSRAKETRSRGTDSMKHMTIDEIKEVNEVWVNMHDSASFNDALDQIAGGDSSV